MKKKAFSERVTPFRADSRTGFTLLELLIVIIILGVLAAIALPQYLRTVERGKSSEAMIHLGARASEP